MPQLYNVQYEAEGISFQAQIMGVW